MMTSSLQHPVLVFFEQAGIVQLLAEQIVNRLGGWIFTVGWFQSVNSLAPPRLVAWTWIRAGREQPVDPAQVRHRHHVQWPAPSCCDGGAIGHGGGRQDPRSGLFMVYVIQSVGELPVADRSADDHQAGPVRLAV